MYAWTVIPESGAPPVPVTVPLMQGPQPLVRAGAAAPALALADGPACRGQAGHGTLGFHPGGRHAGHGAELVFGFVAGTGNVGAAVGLGVAATVGAIVGLGVVITVGDALGPGGGTVGSTAKAVDASPAVINRLSKADAPRRVTRDDVIPLLALFRDTDALRTSQPGLRTPSRSHLGR